MKFALTFLSLLLTSPAGAKPVACYISPCFIEQTTDPVTKRPMLKGVGCQDDNADLYYQGRLKSPKPANTACSPDNDGLGLDGYINRTVLPVLVKAGPVGRVVPECMARAMQRSDSVDSTMTFCPSENGDLDLTRRPTHCPTPQIVNYMTSWLNQAIQCMDPHQQGERVMAHRHSIDSEIIFGILAHESRGNMNTASWAGKGAMQLTTDAVRAFYTPLNTYQHSIWEDASTSSACSPFTESMREEVKVTVERGTTRRGRKYVRENVDPSWPCKMTSPEALPRHLIVAITNLYVCRDLAEQALKSHFDLSRLRSYAASKDPVYKESQKEEIVHDLIMACHNWGAGGMAIAVRRIGSRTFKDAAEFRSTLVSRKRGGGFAATAHYGVAEFPQLVRTELEALKNGEPEFQAKIPGRCAQ